MSKATRDSLDQIERTLVKIAEPLERPSVNAPAGLWLAWPLIWLAGACVCGHAVPGKDAYRDGPRC
jgi:hypothetical protein